MSRWMPCLAFALVVVLKGASAFTMDDLRNRTGGNLEGMTRLDMRSFHMSSFRLRGPIPQELGRLTNLTSLDLYYNELSGPIPQELGRLTNLTILDLSYNDLSGPIPPELGNLKNLHQLDLSKNSLSGPIPQELGKLRNLYRLGLSNNGLSGPIPQELGRLTNLTNLYLSYNDLSGPIPPELGRLTNLTFLDLSYNDMSGPIPPELGNLKNLHQLDLSNNSLSGPIPQELGKLRNLYRLDLSNNGLSGPIPPGLARGDIKLDRNNVESIPEEWCRIGALPALSSLSLSHNPLKKFCFLSSKIACYINLADTPVAATKRVNRLILDYCLGKPVGGAAGCSLSIGDGMRINNDIGDRLNNLCIPGSSVTFLASIWGTLGLVLVVSGCFIYTFRRRLERWMSTTSGPRVKVFKFFLGVGAAVLTIADVVSDLVLAHALQGHWPMLVILFVVALPFLVGGASFVPYLINQSGTTLDRSKFRWSVCWPVELEEGWSKTGEEPLRGDVVAERIEPSRGKMLACFFLAVPLMVMFDCLTILSRCGVQLAYGRSVLGWQDYLHSRTFTEALLEALPQGVLQSVVFAIGTNPAVGWFVDERAFMVSISLGAVSLCFHGMELFLEAAVKKKSLFSVVWDHLINFQKGPVMHQLESVDNPVDSST